MQNFSFKFITAEKNAHQPSQLTGYCNVWTVERYVFLLLVGCMVQINKKYNPLRKTNQTPDLEHSLDQYLHSLPSIYIEQKLMLNICLTLSLYPLLSHQTSICHYPLHPWTSYEVLLFFSFWHPLPSVFRTAPKLLSLDSCLPNSSSWVFPLMYSFLIMSSLLTCFYFLLLSFCPLLWMVDLSTCTPCIYAMLKTWKGHAWKSCINAWKNCFTSRGEIIYLKPWSQ